MSRGTGRVGISCSRNRLWRLPTAARAPGSREGGEKLAACRAARSPTAFGSAPRAEPVPRSAPSIHQWGAASGTAPFDGGHQKRVSLATCSWGSAVRNSARIAAKTVPGTFTTKPTNGWVAPGPIVPADRSTAPTGCAHPPNSAAATPPSKTSRRLTRGVGWLGRCPPSTPGAGCARSSTGRHHPAPVPRRSRVARCLACRSRAGSTFPVRPADPAAAGWVPGWRPPGRALARRPAGRGAGCCARGPPSASWGMRQKGPGGSARPEPPVAPGCVADVRRALDPWRATVVPQGLHGTRLHRAGRAPRVGAARRLPA